MGDDQLNGYIPGFDGLRAVSVGLVLSAHAGYGDVVPGGLGVTVFFFISGFLITILLIDEASRTNTINFKLFYARRLLRLYPELLVSVVLCLISGHYFHWIVTPLETLATVGYFFNYYYVFGGDHGLLLTYPWRQLWSLSVEEHFYLFFPLIIYLTAKRPKLMFGSIIVLLIAPFIWRFVAYYIVGLPSAYNYVATDTRIDSIAWGCLLATSLRSRVEDSKKIAGASYINPALLALGIAIILFSLIYRNEDFRWTWRFTLQGAALFLIISNLLFDARWTKIVMALEYRPIRYIGRISYGLYLYHMMLNRILYDIVPDTNPFFLPLSLVISVAVAALSYRLVEVPLKPLRRSLGSHVQ